MNQLLLKGNVSRKCLTRSGNSAMHCSRCHFAAGFRRGRGLGNASCLGKCAASQDRTICIYVYQPAQSTSIHATNDQGHVHLHLFAQAMSGCAGRRAVCSSGLARGLWQDLRRTSMHWHLSLTHVSGISWYFSACA